MLGTLASFPNIMCEIKPQFAMFSPVKASEATFSCVQLAENRYFIIISLIQGRTFTEKQRYTVFKMLHVLINWIKNHFLSEKKNNILFSCFIICH